MHLRGTGECDKPGCEEDSRKTYYGPNNNALRLCERDYYKLVTDGGELTPELTTGAGDVVAATATGVADLASEEMGDELARGVDLQRGQDYRVTVGSADED